MSELSPVARGGTGPSGGQGRDGPAAGRRQGLLAVVLAGLLICAAVVRFLGTLTPVAAQNTGGPVEGAVDLAVET